MDVLEIRFAPNNQIAQLTNLLADHEHAVETHLSDCAVDVEPVVFLDVLNESVQHDEDPGPSDASATTQTTRRLIRGPQHR